jgi:transposase
MVQNLSFEGIEKTKKDPMAENSTARSSVSQLRLGIPVLQVQTKNSPPKAQGLRHCRFKQQLDAQLVLLPPNLKPLLPNNHLVFFLIETIKHLDLSGILIKYTNKAGIGRSPYDPTMMITLIVYCYSQGTKSTREMERLCKESVPCRVITGNQTPDHDTFANFLAMYREQFDHIFQQVLRIADQAGLVKLEHVAVDGSKIHANASKHKAMSYERMCQSIDKFSKKIETIKEELRTLDAVKNPKNAAIANNLQDEIKYCRKRLAKIRKSKKRLESRVKAKAKVEAKAKKKLKEQGRKIRKIPDPKTVLPEPKEQINFTDPDSRIMGHTGGEFEQCYNAQIAVDSHHQIIVAQDVVQNGNDKKLLEPMFLQVYQRLDRCPESGSADAGYFSEEMIVRESLSSIELFVPPDRETHLRTSKPKIGRIPKNISPADRMRRKLSTTRGKEFYALRKCIVEPVFGQIKNSVFGFDQFSWRGLQNVRNEWALVCAAHNLCKIHRAFSRAPGEFQLSGSAA